MLKREDLEEVIKEVARQLGQNLNFITGRSYYFNTGLKAL